MQAEVPDVTEQRHRSLNLPKEVEPLRAWLEEIKPFSESIEEILGDETDVLINGPRALVAIEFQAFVSMLATAVRLGKVILVALDE